MNDKPSKRDMKGEEMRDVLYGRFREEGKKVVTGGSWDDETNGAMDDESFVRDRKGDENGRSMDEKRGKGHQWRLLG